MSSSLEHARSRKFDRLGAGDSGAEQETDDRPTRRQRLVPTINRMDSPLPMAHILRFIVRDFILLFTVLTPVIDD
jgi:hypothetical protein